MTALVSTYKLQRNSENKAEYWTLGLENTTYQLYHSSTYWGQTTVGERFHHCAAVFMLVHSLVGRHQVFLLHPVGRVACYFVKKNLINELGIGLDAFLGVRLPNISRRSLSTCNGHCIVSPLLPWFFMYTFSPWETGSKCWQPPSPPKWLPRLQKASPPSFCSRPCYFSLQR